MLRIEIYQFCNTTPEFNLYLTCIWRLHWGWCCLSFDEISAPENESPCAIVWHCLCDPMFSHFSKTPTYDRQMDRQTDTQRQLIPVLASAAQVKIGLRMNTNDVTGQCTAVQYKLIMLKCGSRKIEFRWQKTDQMERWITDASVWLLKNRNRNGPTVLRRPLNFC